MIIISDDGNQGLKTTFCTGTRKSGYIKKKYVQLLLYLACETFTACDNVLQQHTTKSHTHTHTPHTTYTHTDTHTYIPSSVVQITPCPLSKHQSQWESGIFGHNSEETNNNKNELELD